MTHDDGSVTKFRSGRFRTADKKEIDKIMSSPNFIGGEVKLTSKLDLVADYLDGKDPDKFKFADLDAISDEGLLKLSEHFRLNPSQTGNKPSLIKRILVGEYLDEKANEIVRTHQKQLKDEALLDKLIEEGKITFKSPWYTYGEEDTKTRDKQEVMTWANENAKELL